MLSNKAVPGSGQPLDLVELLCNSDHTFNLTLYLAAGVTPYLYHAVNTPRYQLNVAVLTNSFAPDVSLFGRRQPPHMYFKEIQHNNKALLLFKNRPTRDTYRICIKLLLLIH